MIHVSALRLLIIIGLMFFLTVGCGVFQPKHEHYNSCGPDAIFYAFRWHDIKSSRVKISREILEDHKAYSLLRDCIAVFDSNLGAVTFPREVKNQLKKYNIKINVVSLEKFRKLKKDENTTAILLVHTKGEINYHWLFYPTQSSSPSTFFGSGTSVDKIYILERAIS
jgi:hypothetical protein